jgi:hypothetical protein
MSEFWEMTIADLNIAVKAYKDKEIKEQKAQVYQAYLISRWVWQKNINIKKILKDMDDEPKGPMTAEQMLEQVKSLNNMFGGEEKHCTS